MLLTDIDRGILEERSIEIESLLSFAEIFSSIEEARCNSGTILDSFLEHDLPGETVFVSHPAIVFAPVIFPELHQGTATFNEFIVIISYFLLCRTFHKK